MNCPFVFTNNIMNYFFHIHKVIRIPENNPRISEDKINCSPGRFVFHGCRNYSDLS